MAPAQAAELARIVGDLARRPVVLFAGWCVYCVPDAVTPVDAPRLDAPVVHEPDCVWVRAVGLDPVP